MKPFRLTLDKSDRSASAKLGRKIDGDGTAALGLRQTRLERPEWVVAAFVAGTKRVISTTWRLLNLANGGVPERSQGLGDAGLLISS